MAEKTEKKTSSIPAMSPAFDCLAVTNVQVYPFKEGANLGHMKGIATIVLNDQIQIRGLRVMDGENGMFVGAKIAEITTIPYYELIDRNIDINFSTIEDCTIALKYLCFRY